MTPADYETRWQFPIDRMRHAVLALGHCNESFLQQFTTEGLMAIHRAWMLCEWDISPDRWTEGQVRDALLGFAPRFDDTGAPL